MMKAAQLYAYDKQMNVDLKVETVPGPTINAPDKVLGSRWRHRFVPYRSAHHLRGIVGRDGFRRGVVVLHHGA